MSTVKDVVNELKKTSTPAAKASQEYFGIAGIDNLGLTTPQMKAIAKKIGKNHALALELWKTGIHEAKHVAIFIADPKEVTEKMMEEWIKDFKSWDTVDN